MSKAFLPAARTAARRSSGVEGFRLTLRELARHLNLSITTVSRALAGYDDVSEATRARVLEAAERLGYQPNPLGQRLRKGRTEAIGLVIPATSGHLGDPFFLELAASLGDRLREHGLDLVLTSCPPGPKELECYRHLAEGRRVDGMVVARTRRQDERIAYLAEKGVPFVCHGRSETPVSFPYVDVDGEHGFRIAAEHLIQLGHRRIGLVNSPEELNFTHHRFRGYSLALEAAGIPYDESLTEHGDLTEESGYRAAKKLLSRDEPPTALLCANDWMAIGAMHAVREGGMWPGKDVSVIGYDDLSVARFTDPPLTTLRQPIRASAERLVDMLIAHMGGAEAESLQEVYLPQLMIRGSSGPPRGTVAKQDAVTRPKGSDHR